jgi:cell division septation protein DedD
MKTENREQRSEIRSSGSGEFDETLRLIARLSPPEGLEERVEAGLRAAASTASGRARILHWPVALRLENAWMQNLSRAAAAAAIVAVVVGGGWGISSRFQPAQLSSAVAAPPHSASQGGFSSAGAMRTPQTLNGPVIAPPATATPQKGKSAGKTPARHGKHAAAKKGAAQKAAPTASPKS